MPLLSITLDTKMGDILQAYPAAKVGLFQKYHIGGCKACGYEATDTLADVCKAQKITDSLENIVAAIEASAPIEAGLHISQEELAAALDRGDPVRLLDVRFPIDFDIARLPDAQLLTVETTFEALDAWPKDAFVVTYSNQGERSLAKASYFRAYGLTNVRSLDGGLDYWRETGRTIVQGKG